MSEKNDEIDSGKRNIKSFLMNYLTFPKLPKDHIELLLMVLVGSMGSGKSTAINYILHILNSIYGDQFIAYRSGDLVKAIKAIEYKYVTAVVIDDAMATPSFDSRRSMSQENVIMSQSLSIARHIARERAKAGILIIIFSIQDPMRLDAFIRRNADIVIYKTYYEMLKKELGDNDSGFLREISEKAMLQHVFSARAYALGVDRVGNRYRFYFPKVDPVPLLDVEYEEDPLEERTKIIKEKARDITILVDKLINGKSYMQLEEQYNIPHTTLHQRLKKLEKMWRDEC